MKKQALRSALAFIIFIGLLAPLCAQSSAPVKPLTIEDIFAPGGLTGRGPENTEWSPDGAKLSFVQRDDAGDHGELLYVDVATGEKKVLVSAAKLASLAPDSSKVKDEREKERLTRYHVAAYLWAPDSKHLIFDSQGQLWLFDLTTSTAVQFTSAPDPSGDPKFSPDGSRVSYVRKHNLYVRSIRGKDETQLTKDTKDDLFNGDIDWVYSEELAVRSNYFWSPDNKEIVFLHMDETKVPTYPIANLIPTHPTVDNEKYPKVGDPNPVVKLGVVDAGKGKVRWISLSTDEQSYIPRFGWVRDGVIWAEVLKRTEDKMDLYFIDAKSGKSRIVLTETTPGAWIDFEHVEVRFLKSTGGFLWPSWRDGNMHLYFYSFDKQNPLGSDAKLERQLTHGDFEVQAIDGVDEAAGTVFFLRQQRRSPGSGIFSPSSWTELVCSRSRRMRECPSATSPTTGTHYAIHIHEPNHGAANRAVRGGRRHASQCGRGATTSRNLELRAPGNFWSSKRMMARRSTDVYCFLPMRPEASSKIPLLVAMCMARPAAQMVLKGPTNPFDEVLARRLASRSFASTIAGTPGRDPQIPNRHSRRVRGHRVERSAHGARSSFSRSIRNLIKTAWRSGDGRMAAP